MTDALSGLRLFNYTIFIGIIHYHVVATKAMTNADCDKE